MESALFKREYKSFLFSRKWNKRWFVIKLRDTKPGVSRWHLLYFNSADKPTSEAQEVEQHISTLIIDDIVIREAVEVC